MHTPTLKMMLQAVLAPSQVMPEDADTVQGWDFVHGCSLDELLGSLLHTGFQATAFGRAVNEVNRMVGPSANVPHSYVSRCPDLVCSAPCPMRINARPVHCEYQLDRRE